MLEFYNIYKKDNAKYIVTVRNNDYCDYMYLFTKQTIKLNISYVKLILTEKYKLKLWLMVVNIYDEFNEKIKTTLFDDKEKYLNGTNRMSS